MVSDEIISDLKAGRSFAVEIPEGGSLVYRREADVLWVDALYCQSRAGIDLTLSALAIAENIARESGCNKIQCDTARIGLVKKLLEQGWQVTLVKKLP